jgi:hypothetical protein
MAVIKWYLGSNGPYGSSGRIANDAKIATPPDPVDDYRYNENGSVWIPKSPQEKDDEKDAQSNNACNRRAHFVTTSDKELKRSMISTRKSAAEPMATAPIKG